VPEARQGWRTSHSGLPMRHCSWKRSGGAACEPTWDWSACPPDVPTLLSVRDVAGSLRVSVTRWSETSRHSLRRVGSKKRSSSARSSTPHSSRERPSYSPVNRFPPRGGERLRRFQRPSKHVAERLGRPAAKALDVAGHNVERTRREARLDADDDLDDLHRQTRLRQSGAQLLFRDGKERERPASDFGDEGRAFRNPTGARGR